MKITREDLKNWFPVNNRFLHYCAKYYGYTFYNDETVEHAAYHAMTYITKMYNEGREFEDEAEKIGIVMGAFRFAILNGYSSYKRAHKLGDRAMSDYEFEGSEDGFNPVESKMISHDKAYDNTDTYLKRVIKKNLPPIEASTVELYFFGGLNIPEIAMELDLPRDKVRLAKHRGLNKLKKIIKEDERKDNEIKSERKKHRAAVKSLPKTIRTKPVESNKSKDSNYSKAMSFIYS